MGGCRDACGCRRDRTGPVPTVRDVNIDEPRIGEVLVRVAACGVCHSDIHALHGVLGMVHPSPFVLGHEPAGIVEAVGDGIKHLRTR